MSEDAGTVTWRAALAEAQRRLAAAGAVNPALEARWLVERASGYEGDEHLASLARPATQRTLAHFDAMLARRLAGEPLQYVLGAWAFRRLDLAVDGRALIPRPETEVVAGIAVDALVARAAASGGRVVGVDLGTGSGAIGLSLAVECPAAEVWLTDRSADALALAAANLAGIGRAGSRVRIAEGDWYAALPAELAGRVDVVVSNPPYVAAHEDLPAEVADWEPAAALVAGPTGVEDIATIVAGAPEWLAPGGTLVVEIAPHQAEGALALADAAGLRPAEVVDDLAGRPRALVALDPPG